MNSSETCLIFNQKHQFGDFKSNLAIFIQKSANLSIFSAKNRQFNTFLKTRTRTRLTGFLKIKTRNPLFQNPTPVLTSLISSCFPPTFEFFNCWNPPPLTNSSSPKSLYVWIYLLLLVKTTCTFTNMHSPRCLFYIVCVSVLLSKHTNINVLLRRTSKCSASSVWLCAFNIEL